MTAWKSEFERYYVGEHVKVTASADAAHRRLDVLEPKVDRLEDTLRKDVKSIQAILSPLNLQAKIIVWVAAVLGLSFITLIWSIIVGKAEVIFR